MWKTGGLEAGNENLRKERSHVMVIQLEMQDIQKCQRHANKCIFSQNNQKSCKNLKLSFCFLELNFNSQELETLSMLSTQKSLEGLFRK